jgi:hypothetical protein
MLKLQENKLKHSKAGGFYASKTEVSSNGIVQNTSQKDNKSQAHFMRYFQVEYSKGHFIKGLRLEIDNHL